MSKSIVELREEIAGKNKNLHDIFAKYPDGVHGMSEEDAKSIAPMNTEITELSIELEKLVDLDTAQKAAAKRDEEFRKVGPPPGGHPSGKGVQPEQKSLRDTLIESKALETLRDTPQDAKAQFEISTAEFKNTIALTDINNPALRLPRLVPSAQEFRTIADAMSQGTTTANSLTFIEETTFTNAAATVAEAGAKPESALDFTERTVPVRKIATWVQATKELLDDVAGFESYVRGRLTFMLERTEESQLLTGTGAGSQITGILNAVGLQTQAKGADPTPDAVYKAITLIRNTGFAEPDAAVFHPNDWQDIRLLRTADGIYIFGSPQDAGVDRIWGLPVRITTAITQNTGLVGAFREYSQIFRREGVTIAISTEHASNFVSNILTILAEERLALAIYRGSAFCTITGI